MALSNDLISQFVKVTRDNEQTKNESTAYGKIVKQGDTEYVQLDGSDLLTPISSTTVVKDGDRVMVTIKNHTAVVTGDFTNPSANNEDVKEIGNKISEFEIVIADKVTTEQLEAEIARIEKLRTDELEATNAKIETIEGKVAKIDTIEADILEVNEKITAHEGEFTTIRGDIADFKDLTAERVDAIEGDFYTLESDYADFKVTTTNKITANEGSIAELETNKLSATEAELKYANIDFSNIGEAAIENLFSDSGIIKDLIMSDGKVTGELVGVTIKGDLIEGNTVKADKLVILGEDGIYYKLNVNSLGETIASSDEKYQNGLDGSNIIAKSITADRVAVTDLVAFGATIGGFHITEDSLYSGVKNSVSNTTQGVFLGDDGQVSIGDANNYLKFFVDEDGVYKLNLQANSIRFGVSNTTIDDAIDNAILSSNSGLSETTNNLNERINKAETLIEQLSNMISHLVTDANGESLMTQTSDGWTFNMSSINDNLTAIKDAMVEMESEHADSNNALEKLTNLVNDVSNKTAYIVMSKDEDGNPCIELGKSDNLFKVRITNTAIDFLEGSTKIAYANNNTFYSETIIVKNELQIGEGPGFVWRTRVNGNMGLIYVSDPNAIDVGLWNTFFKITSYNGSPVINDNPTLSFSGIITDTVYTNLSEVESTYAAYTSSVSYEASTLDPGKTLAITLAISATNVSECEIGFHYTSESQGYIRRSTCVDDDGDGVMTVSLGMISLTNDTDSVMIINGIKFGITVTDSTVGYNFDLTIKSIQTYITDTNPNSVLDKSPLGAFVLQ